MKLMRLFIVSALAVCAFCGCGQQVPIENIVSEEIVIPVEESTPTPTATSTPTATPTPTPSPTPAPTSGVISGKVIVVDAGHGKSSSTKQEAIAPGSSQTKPAFVSGTSGANQTEEELNLAVALKLQSALEEKGATVHMTRTDHTSTMSNIDRAKFGNEKNADISVKIHADGNNNSSISGVSVLIPGGQYISDTKLINDSKAAGTYILEQIVAKTGAAKRGLSVRNDMTGFNWSEVPVVLVEMGFMTNPQEDKLLETDDYQNKIVEGIIAGLEQYFENL